MVLTNMWATILLAASFGVEEAKADMKDFREHTYVGKQGAKLPYRLLRPAHEESGKRYPLVLFLHGAGERGHDNKAPLQWCVEKFAEPKVRREHPCYVVVPQCPTKDRWADVDWSARTPSPISKQPTAAMKSVVDLLDRLEKELKVDPDRLYVAGLSMGGYGTWDLLGRFPKRFAAAVPICGGGDPATAADFAGTAIWAFHGADDTVVVPERSRQMIDALKNAKAPNVKYTEYPNVGHNSWSPAFREPELLPWLFAQIRTR